MICWVTERTTPVETKSRKNRKPFEVFKEGSVSIPIYRHTNIVPQRDDARKIIYGPPDANGRPKALVKYQSDIFTLTYYEGSKRVRLKFSELEKARSMAKDTTTKIANGETEALKLKGDDSAMQKLREWKTEADLTLGAHLLDSTLHHLVAA